MKKILLLFLPVLMFCGSKQPILTEQLPRTSQTFIKKHFSAKIAGCLKDFTEYECYLTDGTKIEFDFVGKLDEVEGIQLPKTLLPDEINKVLDTQFQGQTITKVETKPYGYKIKLNNYLKLTFSIGGILLNQEYD